MKQSLIIVTSFLLAVAALATSGCSTAGPTSQLVGAPAPYTHLIMLDGTTVSLDQFRGKTVVLIFWATWCGHSNRLIPKAAELARRYQGRPNVEFIAVSLDSTEDFEKLKEQIASQNLQSVRHAFSGNESYDEAFLSFRGESVPLVVILDPQGNVADAGHTIGTAESYLAKHRR